MKAKFAQFYQTHIAPKVASLKAKAVQLKERVSRRGARRKRTLKVTAVILLLLVIGATGVAFWRRSPALRAAARGLVVAVSGWLAGWWALLKGHPTEIPVPVVAVEQPPVADPISGAPTPGDDRLEEVSPPNP